MIILRKLKHITSNRTVSKIFMCTSKDKPPYALEKHPESPKGELTETVTKKDLEWRTPWHEKEGRHLSLLRSMYSENSNTKFLKVLQTPLDFSPTAIKKWWAKKQEYKNSYMQQYVPERNQTLGNELAAAHFIVHRGGAVKFFAEDMWIKADEYNQYSLPKHYEADKVLQAIDCTNMNLYYEGLENLRGLKQMEWFSINGCEHMDDWCMDSITCMFANDLLYLDIRNCPLISERGVGALHKIKGLKILYCSTMVNAEALELTCIMLQDLNPDLDIRIG